MFYSISSTLIVYDIFKIGLNIGRVLSERSYSAVLQARDIFTLPKALTSGAGGGGGTGGGVGGAGGGSGRGGNTLTVSTTSHPDVSGTGGGAGAGVGGRAGASGGGGLGGEEGEGEGKKKNIWIQSMMHMVGNSIGLSVAYFMQKTSVTFGGCMMGSEYLLQSFEELADPLLERVALPTLKRTLCHMCTYSRLSFDLHLSCTHTCLLDRLQNGCLQFLRGKIVTFHFGRVRVEARAN